MTDAADQQIFRVVRADIVRYYKDPQTGQIDYDRMLPPPVLEFLSYDHYRASCARGMD